MSARIYEPKNQVRFAIADMGRGIHASLKAHHSVGTDAQAIERALTERISGRSERRNLGMGLANVYGIVRAARGDMFILSLAGVVEFRGSEQRLRPRTLDASFPGTLVFLRLPMRNLTSGTIADLLDPWSL